MEKATAQKLYDAYYMRVYSYLLTLTREKDTAEELTQETFLRACASPGNDSTQAEPCTWLCAIAKHLYYDKMRKAKRELQTYEDLPDEQQNVESKVAKADLSFRIHCALHALCEPYREVFEMRVFGELSFAQIGTVFRKTETWARVTYHRARLKLRERMGESNGS